MIFLSELYLTAWTELPCNFVQRLYRNQVKVFHRGVWISNVTACIDLPGLTWATSLNLFIWQIQVRGTQISNRIACIRFTRLELSCISLCKNEEVISPLKISVHGKIECVLTVCCDFIASSLWGNSTQWWVVMLFYFCTCTWLFLRWILNIFLNTFVSTMWWGLYPNVCF